MIYHDPISHTYYDKTKLIYDSPTKILKSYKQPFNSKVIAKAYAKKHGKTPEYWLKEWKEKSTTALSRGTSIHNTKEEVTYGRGVEVINKSVKLVVNGALFETENLFDLPDGVYPELNIWNVGWRIAGRPDKFVIETIEGKRYIDIYDYKTNGKIDKVSYIDEKGVRKMMKAPLSHLMDANYVHYTLQLSMYAYILETYGFIPRHLEIIHIPHPIDFLGKPVQPADVLYPVPYLKDEVLTMLAHYDAKRKHQFYKNK
jgi:hypothetical protein